MHSHDKIVTTAQKIENLVGIGIDLTKKVAEVRKSRKDTEEVEQKIENLKNSRSYRGINQANSSKRGQQGSTDQNRTVPGRPEQGHQVERIGIVTGKKR